MGHKYILSAILTGSMFLCSCQGTIDDDISDLFEIYADTPSASAVPSEGDGNNFGNNDKDQSENIVRKLVGKWICKKYSFIEDGDEYTESYNDDDHYIQFNADFTATVIPNDLFEAEMRGRTTWQLDGYTKIMFNNDEDKTYSIMRLTSSSLMLGWLEDGKIIEITTFVKAD